MLKVFAGVDKDGTVGYYDSENNKIIDFNVLLNEFYKDSYFLQNIGVFDIKISKGYEAFQKFCMVKKFDADFLLKKIEH